MSLLAWPFNVQIRLLAYTLHKCSIIILMCYTFLLYISNKITADRIMMRCSDVAMYSHVVWLHDYISQHAQLKNRISLYVMTLSDKV